MSGANGIRKFAIWDRNGFFDPLMHRGTEYFSREVNPPITAATISPDEILSDLLLDAATPNALTLTGVSADVQAILAARSENQLGSGWIVNVDNTDPVNTKVITLSAGFTPGSISIPPNSFYQFWFETVTTSPCTIRLVMTLPGGSAGIGMVTSFTGMQGSTRVGPVVALDGDYDSDAITNLSVVAGADVTTALNNLFAQSGVVSFTGAQGSTRQGAVVAINGDYTAPMITYDPTSIVPNNIPATALDVQAALNYLQIFAPTPAAIATIVGATNIPNGAVWTNVPTAYQAAQSRSTYPGGSWAAAADGITMIQAAPNTGMNLVDFSVIVGIGAITANAGNIGIRFLVNGNPFGTSIYPDHGTGGPQEFSCGMKLRISVGDVVRVQVLNNTTDNPVTVVSCTLFVENTGEI